MTGRKLFFIIAALYCLAPLSAQGSGSEQNPGENLTIKVAVMGPGDELYFWWGHIALVIENNRTGRARFYDYGLFSFESDNFFVNFALGRLLYSCGVSPAALNYDVYAENNRDITLYTLDLSPAKKMEVLDFADWNIRPENSEYFYHHFKDNCATRIRDIVDLATDGQFKESFGEAPGRFTLRQHVRRHTWFSPFFDWMLNFLMGQDIDTPITVWEEMFLPSEIGSRIENYSYIDENGVERKLVSGVEILNEAVGRPGVLAAPRKQWPRELLTGIIIALIFVCIFVLKERGFSAGRTLWGLSQALASLFFGIAGLLLFFMTFFTNHDYCWHNINIIFVNPLILAAFPLSILWLRAKENDRLKKLDFALKIIWTYAAVFCLLSGAAKLLPWFHQQNQMDIALFFPIVLPLSFASLAINEFFRRVFWRWFR
ncbi:membrane protein [Spirochaetia bacterium]|nr:membrane protein [Spirochaetia bacterium]